MTGYLLWVVAGVVAAGLATRWQGRSFALEPATRQEIALAALLGALLGAHLLQLPADAFGWHAPPPPGLPAEVSPFGGRTVLGGLIGGWLAVEWQKRRLGVRSATGGGFALPVALALGFGRLGCIAAGCCAGVEWAPGWFATTDVAGVPRVPVQAIEAGFHFVAAGLLALAARRRWAQSRRLAIYFTAYAALRFGLEFRRQHPVVLLGLTWHQWLALVLFGIAGSTWWRRRVTGS